MSLATRGPVNVVDGGDCLVKTKAQVMTIDDGTGLWHPLLGGGMSMVALSRVSQRLDDVTDPCHSQCIQYCIEGRKMDSKVVSAVVCIRVFLLELRACRHNLALLSRSSALVDCNFINSIRYTRT